MAERSPEASTGKTLHVVLAGGGSAGHISPTLALADALRRADPSIGITALGTTKGLETRLIPEHGYELELIPAVPLPRRPTPELMSVPGRLRGTVRKTAEVLDRVGADVVVGFGGYVALPAYLAARRRGLPMVVHEANVRPGLANRIGARLTTHVATSYPDVKLPHATRIGLPLRQSIAALDRAAMRERACESFGLDPKRRTLLVTGGSQGARRLNETIAAAAPDAAAAGVQILHVYGPRHEFTAPAGTGDPAYIAVPYVDEMELAYAAADMLLCRSGANTCAEIAAVGLPACYVPLPIGNGEQRLNAAPVVRAGGGLLVDDSDLNPQWLREHLWPLFADADGLRAMGDAAAGFGRRGADEALVAMVLEAARKPAGRPEAGDAPDTGSAA